MMTKQSRQSTHDNITHETHMKTKNKTISYIHWRNGFYTVQIVYTHHTHTHFWKEKWVRIVRSKVTIIFYVVFHGRRFASTGLRCVCVCVCEGKHTHFLLSSPLLLHLFLSQTVFLCFSSSTLNKPNSESPITVYVRVMERASRPDVRLRLTLDPAVSPYVCDLLLLLSTNNVHDLLFSVLLSWRSSS